MSIITENFEVHEILNPKIWTENNVLKPDVKQALLKIIEEFKSNLLIPLDIVDARIVGSNASFNYTQYSDIDLHLIANFSQLDDSTEILKALYNSERSNFNKSYDIKVKGIDVEIYVEDLMDGNISNGIYSIFNDCWIKFPVRLNIPDETIDISEAVNKWEQNIRKNILNSNSEQLNKLLNNLYIMRKNSLEIDGEYGAGNQIFKEIRNRGLLDEMKDKIRELRSQELTLEHLGW